MFARPVLSKLFVGTVSAPDPTYRALNDLTNLPAVQLIIPYARAFQYLMFCFATELF